MRLSIYSRSDNTGPLVLVPDCVLPPNQVEHQYGPLVFRGDVESDDMTPGADWRQLAEAAVESGFALADPTIGAPLQRA